MALRRRPCPGAAPRILREGVVAVSGELLPQAGERLASVLDAVEDSSTANSARPANAPVGIRLSLAATNLFAMNLHDLPGAIEDPVESLLGFHRRIERQLAALCRLPVHLEVHGVDPGASAAAAAIASFFTSAVPQHHADEERELLPLIDLRLGNTAERKEFRELRQRLDVDHRDMDETWRRLRRPLEAIAEGVHRKLPESLVHYFRAIHSVHISSEEAGVHMLAMRRLRPEDHAVLAHRIRARRTVTRSSHG